MSKNITNRYWNLVLGFLTSNRSIYLLPAYLLSPGRLLEAEIRLSPNWISFQRSFFAQVCIDGLNFIHNKPDLFLSPLHNFLHIFRGTTLAFMPHSQNRSSFCMTYNISYHISCEVSIKNHLWFLFRCWITVRSANMNVVRWFRKRCTCVPARNVRESWTFLVRHD